MDDLRDKLHESLANERRRRLLFGLLEEDPRADSPIHLDAPPDGVIDDESARIEYQHVHLPKLDEYEFIEWAPGTSRVEKGPRFDEIRPVLEVLTEQHEKLPASG